jgi:hypothetical protein
VALDRHGVWLDHFADTRISAVTVALVGADGRPHTVVAGPLESNSSVWIPRSSLTPPLAAATQPRHADITLGSARHRVTVVSR